MVDVMPGETAGNPASTGLNGGGSGTALTMSENPSPVTPTTAATPVRVYGHKRVTDFPKYDKSHFLLKVIRAFPSSAQFGAASTGPVRVSPGWHGFSGLFP